MSTVTRMWLGFAALGAGLVHLALIVSSPLAVGVLLGVIGGAELVWGLVTFVRDRLVAPRIAVFGSFLPVALWAVVVGIASATGIPAIASYLGFDAMALATLMNVFISVTLAVQLRRGTDLAQPTRWPSAPRFLAGVFAGGLVVAILVTPALAATDAGKYAHAMVGMHM